MEGLLEDVDFRLKVTREELEEMCIDLYDRVGKPVKQALEAADMTMVGIIILYQLQLLWLSLCFSSLSLQGEMDSIILMGGGTRVPRVQETLLSVVNK